MGSIFRTVDAAGWSHVYCCGYTGCPPDRRIEKVSLGAEDFIEWAFFEDAAVLCKRLKGEGVRIIALEQTASSQNVFGIHMSNQSMALVLGNEVEGVSTEVLAEADQCLEIPMFGQKSSLNVSVAAGIALYQLGGV